MDLYQGWREKRNRQVTEALLQGEMRFKLEVKRRVSPRGGGEEKAVESKYIDFGEIISVDMY